MQRVESISPTAIVKSVTTNQKDCARNAQANALPACLQRIIVRYARNSVNSRVAYAPKGRLRMINWNAWLALSNAKVAILLPIAAFFVV